MIFGNVGCLWFGLVAVAHGSAVLFGGWTTVLSKVSSLRFGLVGVAHHSVGLDSGWKDKVVCLWFLFVGVAPGSVGLVGGWTVIDKVWGSNIWVDWCGTSFRCFGLVEDGFR